jgi:hypothetical protein
MSSSRVSGIYTYSSGLKLDKKYKVETPIMDRGPIADFIFKGHILLKHVSMKAIDNYLKLRRSGIGSSTLWILAQRSWQRELDLTIVNF